MRRSCGFPFSLMVTKNCLLTVQVEGLYTRPTLECRPFSPGRIRMFLVMGITGKVGGAAARHLLAQGKKVRALVRDRTKTEKWADQSVELIDGDWNDATAVARALEGIEGAIAMVPPGWTPSPDFREFKEVVAAYK